MKRQKRKTFTMLIFFPDCGQFFHLSQFYADLTVSKQTDKIK